MRPPAPCTSATGSEAADDEREQMHDAGRSPCRSVWGHVARRLGAFAVAAVAAYGSYHISAASRWPAVRT